MDKSPQGSTDPDAHARLPQDQHESADHPMAAADAPPLRKSIAPLLVAAAALWGGSALCEEVMWRHWADNLSGTPLQGCGTAELAFLACAPIALLASLVAYRLHHRRHVPAVLTLSLFMTVGFLCGIGPWHAWEGDVQGLSTHPGGRRHIEVTGDATASRYGGWRTTIELVTDTGRRVELVGYWQDGTTVPAAGMVCDVYGTVSTPKPDDKGKSSHQQLRCGTMRCSSPSGTCWASDGRGWVGPFRESISARIERVGGDGAALLAGIVIGKRTMLSSGPVEENFRTCGLSHLIAVSGSHLVIASSLVAWVLGRLPLRRITSQGALGSLLIAYVALTGFQTSAIRACIMTLVGMLGWFMRRRRDSASAVGLCACILISLDPSAAFSLSLQLSTASVVGITYLAPLIECWIAHILPRQLTLISQPLAITVAAQLSTLVPSVSTFGTVSLIAPVANLIVAPLVSTMLTIGLAAAFVNITTLQDALLTVGSALGNIAARIAALLGTVPSAQIELGFSLLGAAVFLAALASLWLFWPMPSKRAVRAIAGAVAFTALIVLVTFALPSPAQVVVLDIGQGDAILIEQGYARVLVDTGRPDGAVNAALMRQHVGHLDAVVITHLHNDHYGGLAGLQGHVSVDAVYIAEPILRAYPNHEAVTQAADLVGADHVKGLSKGDVLHVGAFDLRDISPAELTDEGGNQDSICMLTTYDEGHDGAAEGSMLLTGDAESQTTQRLISEGSVRKVDVLKVGHHGSEVSLSEDTLDVLCPQAALISVGANNDYGHPDPATLSILESHRIPCYRTDTQGDLTVRFNGFSIQVGCSGNS